MPDRLNATVRMTGLEVQRKPFVGTDRFSVLAQLGEGAFGSVYRALDRETGSQVALKVLRLTEANALFRLKKEFRSLVDLRHPNLARLHELHEHDGRWFFSMELIEGTDFLSHVRRAGGSFDEERLRAALMQLAIAVHYLHVSHKVHRDIKPANIRVDPGGRLVLLDFGLVSNTIDGRQTTAGGLAGTIAYMAPEQALGEQVGPEADWYSVGVVLYEALTGQVPSNAWPPRAREEPAVEPRVLVSAVPEDLNALCMALLMPKPEQRPSGQAVIEVLGARHASEPVAALPAHGPFIGRQREQRALTEAAQRLLSGAPSVVLVTGESGVGKSALVQEFARTLPSHAVLLAGRCFEQELVPYKAFDGVVDALSSFLLELTGWECAALTPRRAVSLTRVFPVLGRVPSISAAPQMPGTIDDVAVKNYAFAALRDLLALVAERRPLVIVIDDVQWADAESLILLDRLVAPPDAPNMLVVLAGRPLRECSRTVQRALSALLERAGSELALHPLSLEESQNLAQAALGQGADSGTSAAIAQECGGNPLLLSILTRQTAQAAGPLSLAEALRMQLADMSAPAAALFEHLCVAGTPLSNETMARASGFSEGAVAELCTELKTQKLVRAGGRRGLSCEVFHDRIRAAVLSALSQEQRQRIHGNLARAFERASTAPAELIAHHFVEAGRPEQAAQYAVQAAQRAHEGLAFERAVHFYRLALGAARGGDPQYVYGLRVRLGDALSACGRSADAAEAYLAAASVLEGLHNESGARNLRVRAANCLLESGHGPRGTALLENELAAVGIRMPKSRAATLTRLAGSIFLQRLQGFDFVRRELADVPAIEQVRMDACAAAAIGLAGVDPWRSAYFQSLYLRFALRAGDPARVGHALTREGMYTALLRADVESPAAQRLLSVVDGIANELADPLLIAFVEYLRAVQRYGAGRFHEALPRFTAAQGMLGSLASEVRGELVTLQQLQMDSMQHMGLWAELSERVDEDLRSARERGDLYTAAYLQLAVCPFLALARDDVMAAEDDISQGPHHLGAASVTAKDLLCDLSVVALRIYTGRYEGLADWGKSRWTVWRNAWLVGVPLLRVQGFWIQVRAVLGELCVTPTLPSSLVREVERLARELDRTRMPYGPGYAAMSRACLLLLRGEPVAAGVELERAEGIFAASGMGLLVQVARLRRGQQLGAEGRALCVEAEQFMHAQGIKKPLSIAQVFAPVRPG